MFKVKNRNTRTRYKTCSKLTIKTPEWYHWRRSGILNGIKVQVLFGKNIEKKHLHRHDKNYYYFCKSNIPVTNSVVGSRNMIKVSKNMSF